MRLVHAFSVHLRPPVPVWWRLSWCARPHCSSADWAWVTKDEVSKFLGPEMQDLVALDELPQIQKVAYRRFMRDMQALFAPKETA